MKLRISEPDRQPLPGNGGSPRDPAASVGGDEPILLAEQGELVIEKADVERRVMDDQLSVFDKLEELVGDLAKTRLILEVFIGDAVNGDGAFIDLAIRLQIDVKVPAGQAPEPALVLRRWTDLLAPGGRLLLIEGCWHTGGGLHAEAVVAALPPAMVHVVVQPLSEQPDLWGGAVTDERYLVVAEHCAS